MPNSATVAVLYAGAVAGSLAGSFAVVHNMLADCMVICWGVRGIVYVGVRKAKFNAACQSQGAMQGALHLAFHAGCIARCLAPRISRKARRSVGCCVQCTLQLVSQHACENCMLFAQRSTLHDMLGALHLALVNRLIAGPGAWSSAICDAHCTRHCE